MKRQDIHHIIYIGCLLILACAIPVSNFMMSMGGLLLALNWAAEWNWREKWNRLKSNKLFIVLSVLFFICALTLLNTDNWHAGIENLASKLPFLYMPGIIVSSRPLNGKEQRLILNGFIISTLTATIISIIYLCTHDILDIREISLFTSHIRFSLCILLAVCLSVFIALRIKVYSKVLRIIYLFTALWFIIYLFIAQTLTGIFILFCLLFFLFFYFLFKIKNLPYRNWIITGISIFILSFSGYMAWTIYDYYHVDPKKTATLDKKTKSGNPYYHDPGSIVENGSPIDTYISQIELREGWGKRSSVLYDDYLEKTLVRYLNSKGLRKDLEGVEALTDKDISYIEQGIANVNYTKGFGIKRALYPIFFSISLYERYNKSDNSSLFQRVELWKASLNIIKSNCWFGVGIGDQKSALDEQLTAQNSSLVYKKGMGSHNQFLTYWLIGGIFLLLYFIFTLVYPFLVSSKTNSLLYILFFLIIFISLFTEDTLETQVGINLYTFFNSFFLFIFNKSMITDEKTFFHQKK